MRVKALCNMGTRDYGVHALMDGQEGDVPQQIACRMVASGHAVEILPPAPVAVAPMPEPVIESQPDKPAPAAPPVFVPKVKHKEK